MAEGWLLDCDQRWAYRFHRDEKSWLRDPKVFVDMGRPMPDGSPALLKTRQHLRREDAEKFWKNLELGPYGVAEDRTSLGCFC